MGELDDAANKGEQDRCHEGEFNGGGAVLASWNFEAERS